MNQKMKLVLLASLLALLVILVAVPVSGGDQYLSGSAIEMVNYPPVCHCLGHQGGCSCMVHLPF